MHKFKFFKHPASSGSHSRRGGSVVIYFALSLVVFLGIAALVVDMGYRYLRRADAQKAADAGALSGVYAQMTYQDTAYSTSVARYYTQLNRYTNAVNGVTVTTQWPADGQLNRYQVTVSRLEPLCFGGILKPGTNRVGASATAEMLSLQPISINGTGSYGVRGSVNLSVFGPDGDYNNGDAFSVKQLMNGADNPRYNGKGYNFVVDVPSNYETQFSTSQVQVEIFDPDGSNATSGSPNGTTRLDELWGVVTTTKYSLYYDNNTPNNPDDDTLIGSKSYGNGTSATDMQWVQDSAFKFDRDNYGAGKFRLNVTSTAGESENGFFLRAGPPHSTSMTDTSWNTTYGNKAATALMTATGNLPINFNTSGTVTVALGAVAAGAAGGKMYISKFDTDVGSKSVVYSCDTLSQTFPGVLAANGTWSVDAIDIPSNFTGGNWTATYTAGVQDTSVWSMSFSKYIPGSPGVIRLVK